MEHGQLTHQVRARVTERFRELGVEHEAAVRETILIRDGNYFGRRFEADGAEAIWLAEDDRLTFRATENEHILKIPHAAPATMPLTKAA